jgi:hypothetical protein
MKTWRTIGGPSGFRSVGLVTVVHPARAAKSSEIVPVVVILDMF